MIVAEHLTKYYGTKRAVSDVSFTVAPGRVTGFLGPNGAGKSTTMRMIVGLDRPTSGRVDVAGETYAKLRSPLTEVGVLLDAKAVHGGRSARNHLRALAATHGLPSSRVEEVIGLTGLGPVASRRAGSFSLGMGQRLGIASALLGDPRVVILDEPVNGLDPEGVRWVRDLVRRLAGEGRTVLLSSHLMSEMSMTADHLIVMGRGRILADAPLEEIVRSWTTPSVRLRSPRSRELVDLLIPRGARVLDSDAASVTLTEVPMELVAETAAAHRIPLYELTSSSGSLEDAYLALTHDEIEYKTKEPA